MPVRLLVVGRGHIANLSWAEWSVPEHFQWRANPDLLDVQTLRALAPEAILYATGMTDVDACEADPTQAVERNVNQPVELYRRAQEALGARATFVHLGTACIWDGPYRPDGRPFDPLDEPSPVSVYSLGKTKCEGTLMRRQHTGRLLLLRPRLLHSHLPFRSNLLQRLLGYRDLTTVPNSVTSWRHLARAVEWSVGLKDRTLVAAPHDLGAATLFAIGTALHRAALRPAPGEISWAATVSRQRARRVNVVVRDERWEREVAPRSWEHEIETNARRLAAGVADQEMREEARRR